MSLQTRRLSSCVPPEYCWKCAITDSRKCQCRQNSWHTYNVQNVHTILLPNSLCHGGSVFRCLCTEKIHVCVHCTAHCEKPTAKATEEQKRNLSKHENECNGVKMNGMKCKLSTGFAEATGIFAQFGHLLAIFHIIFRVQGNIYTTMHRHMYPQLQQEP